MTQRPWLAAGLAWLVGAFSIMGTHSRVPGWLLADPDLHVTLAIAIAVFGTSSMCAARIAASRRAGVLEAAGVLVFAAFPLMLVELLSFHPDLAIPQGGHPTRWMYGRFQLQLGYTMAEATAQIGLVAGALGLLQGAVRRPVAPWLAGLGVLAGLLLGGMLFPSEGWMLGGPLGLAAVVFPATARAVRGPGSAAGRGARGLAVLAVAMGAVLATDGAWVPSSARGPAPYLHLWPMAEGVIHAYRTLTVRLGGCVIALAFALVAGRRASRGRSPSRSTKDSAPVLLLAGVCWVGSTAHLQRMRIDVFNWQWAHAQELADARLLCTCHGWEHVPTVGSPVPAVPLPWPLRGRVGPAFPRSVIRVDVDLTYPVMERVDGELERIQALPRLDVTPLEVQRNDAPEQQIQAPDDISYGDFIRGLDRAADTHETHLHLLIDNPAEAPAR